MLNSIANRLLSFKDADRAFYLFKNLLLTNTQDLDYVTRVRILAKCILIRVLMKNNAMVQTAQIIRPEAFNASKKTVIAIGMLKVTLPTGVFTVKSINQMWTLLESNRRRAMIEYVRLDGTRMRIFATLKQGEWFIQEGTELIERDKYSLPSIITMSKLRSVLDAKKKAGEIKTADVMNITSKIEIQCMKLGVYN